MKTYFNQGFLDFFKELAPNNHKNWFDENKKRYETEVKKPFELFVQDAIIKLTENQNALEGLDYKKCIFRINKDIRFSKDKSPYKLNKSALIAPNGKGSMSSDGVYFEFGPEKVAFYTGFYMPDKEQLIKIRRKIAYDISGFRNIINEKEFIKNWGLPMGDKNKILDKEFKEKALEEPCIWNKSLFFMSELDGNYITNSNLMQTLISKHKALNKFNAFFNNI